jgi:hypothetical protein
MGPNKALHPTAATRRFAETRQGTSWPRRVTAKPLN